MGRGEGAGLDRDFLARSHEIQRICAVLHGWCMASNRRFHEAGGVGSDPGISTNTTKSWHHVLEPGDGRANFSQHAGGLTPVVGTFEGNDLLNFGAVNASQNRDLVTTAVGFRSHVCDHVDLGFAYEFPLTSDEKGIIEDRFTVDLVWRF